LAAALARAQPPPAAPSAEAPYQDRYIAGGTLTPDISAGDYLTSDPSGLARSLRIDAVASMLSQQGAGAPPAVNEDGVVADAQWDTASFGAWSADLGARTGGTQRSAAGNAYGDASFALHQRGMPFDDGWQLDNALGDLNTPLIDLARQQPRFLLTSAPMQGFDTEWRGPAGLQLLAGAGEPGIYEGIKVPTFQTLGGTTGTLGAQWSPAPHWSVGAELAAARDVTLYYESLDNTATTASLPHFSSNTGFLSAGWQEGSTRAQLNVIDGSVDGLGNAFGAWLDAAATRGAFTNAFGLFRIDPNLAWGNQVITNDVQGGYYRLGYQTRRWVADIGVDAVRSVSGDGVSTTFVNADARYQLSRDVGVGGVANLRHSDSDNAWSLEGYVDEVNGLGTGRLQLDYATDAQTSDAGLTLQQSWNMHAGTRLSTSLSVDRSSGSAVTPGLLPTLAQQSTLVRLALYGGGDLSARLSLDGSVQWADAIAGHAAPATTADVSLIWQLAPGWSLFGTYYENRIGSWTPLVVTSPLAPATPTVVPAIGQRGMFLTIRYQAARGAHFAPLGGSPGAGAGRLTGVIYLDANENGRFDAGETGAANVTVILDGRFSTRTDGNGRFDFPALAAGHHVLRVQGDNLPLPWTLADEGRTEVEVGTRDRVDVNIGALRLK
ncbi:MAG TPA: SdrD B-like domain-containing protein, partial [Candidatus Dormibacteraeota bacterium]|nr:SdrD B-like domain-containing protein [Candidatus Dormibacteraeota bacterium]